MEETAQDVDIRSTMVELKLLDLKKVHTVSELVEAMSLCSFGARMLGEAAATLTAWVQAEKKPLIVYDGELDTPLCDLLRSMCSSGWFRSMGTTQEFAESSRTKNTKVVVVGNYMERHAKALYEKADEILFINATGQAKPGQVRDGYFPRFVPSDPCLIMPILASVLDERLNGTKCTMTGFMASVSRYGGLATELFEGTHVLHQTVHGPDVFMTMTLAGAMTIAKMGLLVCDLIENKIVHCISSTGALMAHGLIEGIGRKHYKHNPKHTDKQYSEQKINRVTDTLEPEENFADLEEILAVVFGQYGDNVHVSPSDFHRDVGKYLTENFPGQRGILKSAYEHGVPVLTPAFIDSEIGNDYVTEVIRRKLNGRGRLIIDPALDSEFQIEMATKAKRRAIFSIGGGTPGNNTRNVAPLVDIVSGRLGLNLPPVKYFYGVKIDPTPMWFGNYGGCTKEEAMGWNKFELGGQFVDVHADATITWPFMQKYLMENLRDRPWIK